MDPVDSWIQWVKDHWDRLVAPTQGGSTYGCGLDPAKISCSGWFEHGPGARRGEQRSISMMFASPTHGPTCRLRFKRLRLQRCCA